MVPYLGIKILIVIIIADVKICINVTQITCCIIFDCFLQRSDDDYCATKECMNGKFIIICALLYYNRTSNDILTKKKAYNLKFKRAKFFRCRKKLCTTRVVSWTHNISSFPAFYTNNSG